MYKNKCTAIVGAQWGDEGKGKLVDAMCGEFDFVCRATGGANAGHTIVADGQKYVFHVLPSGLLHPNTMGIIGNGVALHVPTLAKEITNLEKNGLRVKNRIKISQNTSLLLDYHMRIDAELERRRGDGKIGTTCRGIGPCYTEKMARRGIKMGLIFDEDALQKQIEENCAFYADIYGLDLDPVFEFNQIEPFLNDFREMVTDTAEILHQGLQDKKNILLEGAQGYELDIDHGTYPYVTSSNVSTGGFVTGLGIAPQAIGRVIGIVKAYTSRVGEGPFATELFGELQEFIREAGHEYGSTTGRPRRVGWLDAVKVKKACQVNGITDINVTKLDVLTGLTEIKVRTGGTDVKPEYESFNGWKEDITAVRNFADLPENAQIYMKGIETLMGVKVSSIGVGPDRTALIFPENS